MKNKETVEEKITTNNTMVDEKNLPLSKQVLRKMKAYWRAANYLSVGQLYLRKNPLLKESLKLLTVLVLKSPI